MSLMIEQMGLSPNAFTAATIVQRAHPWVQFTSGRRDAYGQARAMAANVIRYGAAWLDETYRDKRMVALLMTYTIEHPELCTSVKALAGGFYETLTEHYSGDLLKMPHLRGDAFDCAWPVLTVEGGASIINRPAGEQLITTIRALPFDLGLELVLEKEGKLDVIHAQFKHQDIASIAT